jgi:hypothetical protein
MFVCSKVKDRSVRDCFLGIISFIGEAAGLYLEGMFLMVQFYNAIIKLVWVWLLSIGAFCR